MSSGNNETSKLYVIPEHNQPIRRGAAMEAVWMNDDKESIIEAILSIQSDDCRPRGKWMPGKELKVHFFGGTEPRYLDWHCSVCGCVSECHIKPNFTYCPACGANLSEEGTK